MLAGCGVAPGLRAEKDAAEVCGGYPDIAVYELPWAPGQSHKLVQGNCGAHTNKGIHRFAYEFAMPVGTAVHAARAGTVTTVVQSNAEGSSGGTNYVRILHADNTFGVYQSLGFNGATVATGDYVAAGQSIGVSGTTGFVSQPLLRFEVAQLEDGIEESMPFSFANSGSVSQPLKEGSTYPVTTGGLRGEP